MNNILAEQSVQSVNWLLELLKMIASFGAIYFGLWVWHRQKVSEPKYQSMEFLNQKKLDGLMAIWSLLAFITEVENSKAILIWSKNDEHITYYFRPIQAREYIDCLSVIFYGKGYGLLLNREIKGLLFEYRNIIYGILLKNKCVHEGDDNIELESDLVKRLKGIYEKLNKGLRNELTKIQSQVPNTEVYQTYGTGC